MGANGLSREDNALELLLLHERPGSGASQSTVEMGVGMLSGGCVEKNIYIREMW